ncbi:MAG: hypothetical protein FD163_1828 [Hyphomonadaceae bacterium]|nr:MAG: hypothetical protein FD128_553 [Hyphomonadaceae bacterium]KAF0184254.1 MAG: hypothetical protein FD163_1828 [Hyphomonadaceae bacterium]
MKFTSQQLVAAGYPPTMEQAQPWLNEVLRDIRTGYPKASEAEVNQMLEATIVNRYPPHSLEHANEILMRAAQHKLTFAQLLDTKVKKESQMNFPRPMRLAMAAGLEALAQVEEDPQEKQYLLKRVEELRVETCYMKFTTQQLVAAGYPPTMEQAQPWLLDALKSYRKGYPKATDVEINQLMEAEIVNHSPPHSLEHALEILEKAAKAS